MKRRGEQINQHDYTISSRDVIARIKELEGTKAAEYDYTISRRDVIARIKELEGTKAP